MTNPGIFYGIGVGPGDPELLTVKAVRLIGAADLIVYPATFAKESTARAIAADYIRPGQPELAITLPMQQADRGSTEAIYREFGARIAKALASGTNVIFLCLGDPLLYGSFIYLYDILKADHPCQVVPGITSVSAASAAGLIPLTLLNQTLLILPALCSDAVLSKALKQHDSLVIMKAGRHRHRIAGLIHQAGRVPHAVYIEHATMQDQTVIPTIADLPDGPGSYFSLFLVSKNQ